MWRRRDGAVADLSPTILGLGRLFALAATLHAGDSIADASSVYLRKDTSGHAHWTTHPTEAGFRREFALPSKSSAATANEASAADLLTLPNLRSAASALMPLVVRICDLHQMDPAWVLALIEVESGFNNNAISPKGARGLMQLMPRTARDYGMRHVQELHQPERNLDIGIRHLKHLLSEHQGNWPLTLAAYNAGGGAVARHGQRIPRYSETMLYVPAVLTRVEHYRHWYPAAQSQTP